MFISESRENFWVLNWLDEFDFGAKRCQRFIERMNLKAECIVDDLATWDDYRQAIQERLGFEIKIRWND